AVTCQNDRVGKDILLHVKGAAIVEAHQLRATAARIVERVRMNTRFEPAEVSGAAKIFVASLNAESILRAEQVQHLTQSCPAEDAGGRAELDASLGSDAELIDSSGSEIGVLRIGPNKGANVKGLGSLTRSQTPVAAYFVVLAAGNHAVISKIDRV